MAATEEESRAFAASYTSFLNWVHRAAPHDSEAEVVDLVRAHLGATWADRSVVTRELPVLEHVNLQAALYAWSAEPGRRRLSFARFDDPVVGSRLDPTGQATRGRRPGGAWARRDRGLGGRTRGRRAARGLRGVGYRSVLITRRSGCRAADPAGRLPSGWVTLQ